MTVQQIIDYCSENYQEISLADHIKHYYNSDISSERLCSVSNNLHKLFIQAIIEDNLIDEIYINYEENDPGVAIAFLYSDAEKRLSYWDLRDLDSDMGWLS